MKEADYYIENIDLHAHPELGDRCEALVSVAFDPGDPTHDEENNWLVCDCTLEIDLHEPGDLNDEEDGISEPSYGELTVEFRSVIEGENPELQEVKEQWEEEGYESLDQSVIGKIENGVLSDILVPVDSLIGDSIRGILPRIRFTTLEDDESPEDESEDEEE